MSSLQIGRLLVGPPGSFNEQIGDPVAAQGGAVVPAPRVAPQYPVTVATIGADGQADTLAARMTIRRQLRSLLANTPLKLGAFLYVIYSDDPENNGWYVPDQATLQDLTGSIGLATGWWQFSSANWYLMGRQRTHQEARQAWVKDLRTGLYARDYLGQVYSTDFSGLSALTLSTLPPGASSVADGTTGAVTTPATLSVAEDGSQCSLVEGLTDLTVLFYDRAETSLNQGDVVCYDRRGAQDAPSFGPGPTWEECYGPDWPYNWQTAGQPADTPVIDNGLVRVRYTDVEGGAFAVDVWNGSSWALEGVMGVARDTTGSGGFVSSDIWVSARMAEWTPEHAVIECVLSVGSTDPYSRERVYITVQRGWTGAKFEVYPAALASGTATAAQLVWAPVAGDAADSAFISDTQTLPTGARTGWTAASAGTGGVRWDPASTGEPAAPASFASAENFVAILRCPTSYTTVGPYQHALCPLQAAAIPAFGYGQTDQVSGGNYLTVASPAAAGWVGGMLTFAPTVPGQVMEAETIRNTASVTTAQTTDATASGGEAVSDSQTAPTNPTLSTTAHTFPKGKYRCFARVKSPSGVAVSITWGLGGVAGPFTATTTSTTWVWLDLGDILNPVSSGTSFTLTAWQPSSGDTAQVDRVELYLVENRTTAAIGVPAGVFDGCRDRGQAALVDSRMLGALVAR